MMQIKPGASLQGLDNRMRPALVAASRVYGERGKEVVVTSGLDGEHSPGSRHYEGLAVDLRTRYFSDHEEVRQVAAELESLLGMAFDVVVEPNHIHVEWAW